MSKTPSQHPKRHVMIVAGEASGDLHGAHLVEALKKIHPHLAISGIGGSQMKNSGVDVFTDLTQIAVVGFFEVLRHYPEFKKAFDDFLDRARSVQPEAVILIDYPGFNLRLAKQLHAIGIKVIYYISPQVWAWKAKRVELIRECVDLMLVIFPFEKDFYAKNHYTAHYVGHPLVEQIESDTVRTLSYESMGLEKSKPVIALMPGSRQKEVERHLPIMVDSIKKIRHKFPQAQYLLIQAPTIADSWIDHHLDGLTDIIKISKTNPVYSLRHCDLCIVASGTATLQAGLLGIPMVVIYKTSWITWCLARLFVKIPYIGLVNIVAKEELVPELIQHRATAEQIFLKINKLLSDPEKYQQVQKRLFQLKEQLGDQKASHTAAEMITRCLDQS